MSPTARSPTADVADAQRKPPEDEVALKRKEAADWRRIIVALGFVALLVAMVLAVGPIPAIFVFTLGYFVISGHFRPLKAIAYAMAFTVSVYVVFVVILKIQLYLLKQA